MKKKLFVFGAAAALLGLWLNLGQAQTAAQPAKVTIKEVMNKAMKGNTSLAKKVGGGTGTEADAKELLSLYESLAANKPPKGDDASWKTKTGSLVTAAKAVVDKEAGATQKLTTATATTACSACHTAHKGG